MFMLRSVICGGILAVMVQSATAAASRPVVDLHTGKLPFSTPAAVSAPEPSVNPVPEPSTFLLGLSGFGAMLAFRRMFFR